MNGDGLHAPRRLERNDATENFHSGAEDLDDWLARLAWQNQRSRDTVTYVSTQDGEILGYYAIAMASYARDEAARAFYRANGDFLASPADPMHLLLPMKQVRRMLNG